MNNLFLSIFIFLLFFQPIKAQNITFKIQKSDIFTDSYKNTDLVFSENDNEGGIVIIRQITGSLIPIPKGYIIERYDSDFKLLNKFEYETNMTEEFIGLFIKDRKINIIERNYDRKEKVVYYNCLSSDINDFVFSTKKLCSEAINLKMFELQNLNNLDTAFNPILSFNKDKSAFTIIHETKDKNVEKYKLFVFSSNLNQNFAQEFTREIKDKKYRFENIELSKDGNTIYLLGKVFVDQNKKKGGDYQYELSRISTTGFNTQIIDTQEHYINSLKSFFLEDKLFCLGFYSDEKEYRYKGLYYVELDPTSLKINHQKYNPFSNQFLEDKYGKVKDKELTSLFIKGIFFNSNNEIILNAEETYITSSASHNYTSGIGYTAGQTSYVYHYDDIVSVKLNNQGDLIWARNINKKQSTSDSGFTSVANKIGYLSYTSVLNGDYNYFFINAGEKVKEISNDRIQFKQTSKNNSNLNVIRIDKNGNFDYQEIIDDKENEIPFLVSDGISTKSSVIFIGRKGKDKQLLKITL